MICCFCVDDDFHGIWRKVGVEVVWDEQTDRKKSLGSNNDNRDDDDMSEAMKTMKIQPSEDVDVEIEVPTWLIFGAS